MKFFFQMKQFFFFTLHHLADRNSRPSGNDIGNIFRIHLFLDHGSSALQSLQFFLNIFYFLFFGRNLCIPYFSDFFIIALSLRTVGLKLKVLYIDFVLLNFIDQFLFGFPLSFKFRFFLFQIGNFLIQRFQLIFIIFSFDRLPFDFQLFDTTRNLIQSLRNRIYLKTQLGGSFIH